MEESFLLSSISSMMVVLDNAAFFIVETLGLSMEIVMIVKIALIMMASLIVLLPVAFFPQSARPKQDSSSESVIIEGASHSTVKSSASPVHQSPLNSSSSSKSKQTNRNSTSPYHSPSTSKGRPAELYLEPESSSVKSVSLNTPYDLDDFLFRLYKTGFAVLKLKTNGKQKPRCLSLNLKLELCLHHGTKKRRSSLSSGWKAPFSELLDCFPCEGSTPPSFIMEFKDKTNHLGVSSALDVTYIVNGLKMMISKYRKDHSSFEMYCKNQLSSLSLQNGVSTPSTSRSEDHQKTHFFYEDDFDQSTISTITVTPRHQR